MQVRGKTSEEKLNNPVICQLCKKELKNLLALSAHLIQQHNHFLSREYYDKFFKKENEGSCLVCDKQTNWETLGKGYKKFCSTKCAGKYKSLHPELYPKPIFSDETKKKISRLGFKHSTESLKKMRASQGQVKHWWKTYPNLGLHHSEETCKKISEKATGRPSSLKGIPLSNKSKESIRQARLRFYRDGGKNWNHPEVGDGSNHARWKKIVLAKMNERPNKFETRCFGLLEILYPSKFKYVGDGSILINYKSPDYIWAEEKIVVLCNGIYWHCKRFGIEDTPENRIKIQNNESLPFQAAGYKVWFIWEEKNKKVKESLIQ
jgi:hypothetical protein